MMGAEYISPLEQMCRSIDREVLDDLRTMMLTEAERCFIGFFCAIGPAASAVLEDMALEGYTWPGCYPYPDLPKKRKRQKPKRSRR